MIFLPPILALKPTKPRVRICFVWIECAAVILRKLCAESLGPTKVAIIIWRQT